MHTGGGFGGKHGVTIIVRTDGTVHLLSGHNDPGTGSFTTAQQVTADAVGSLLTDVAGTFADTDASPFATFSSASQTINDASIAIKAAAEEIKKQLFEVAATLLSVTPAELSAQDSKVFLTSDPTKGVTFKEVLTKLGREIVSSVSVPIDFTLVWAARFVELEVDTDTGEIELLRTVLAFDLGRCVNPLVVEGQMEGGWMQGIGYAITESSVNDQTTGVLLSSDEISYAIPTTLDTTCQVDTILLESGDPTAAFGIKGCGEPPIVSAPAAIANAVYNAIGVRIHEMPLTPGKILQALNKV